MHKRGVFLRMLMHEDVIFAVTWYAAPSSTTYGDSHQISETSNIIYRTETHIKNLPYLILFQSMEILILQQYFIQSFLKLYRLLLRYSTKEHLRNDVCVRLRRRRGIAFTIHDGSQWHSIYSIHSAFCDTWLYYLISIHRCKLFLLKLYIISERERERLHNFFIKM